MKAFKSRFPESQCLEDSLNAYLGASLQSTNTFLKREKFLLLVFFLTKDIHYTCFLPEIPTIWPPAAEKNRTLQKGNENFLKKKINKMIFQNKFVVIEKTY